MTTFQSIADIRSVQDVRLIIAVAILAMRNPEDIPLPDVRGMIHIGELRVHHNILLMMHNAAVHIQQAMPDVPVMSPAVASVVFATVQSQQAEETARQAMQNAAVASAQGQIARQGVFARPDSPSVLSSLKSGVVQFKCTKCDHTTKRKSDAKKHYRKHTGEKPYKCPTCGISFSDPSTRSRHVKAHEVSLTPMRGTSHHFPGAHAHFPGAHAHFPGAHAHFPAAMLPSLQHPHTYVDPFDQAINDVHALDVGGSAHGFSASSPWHTHDHSASNDGGFDVAAPLDEAVVEDILAQTQTPSVVRKDKHQHKHLFDASVEDILAQYDSDDFDDDENPESVYLDSLVGVVPPGGAAQLPPSPHRVSGRRSPHTTMPSPARRSPRAPSPHTTQLTIDDIDHMVQATMSGDGLSANERKHLENKEYADLYKRRLQARKKPPPSWADLWALAEKSIAVGPDGKEGSGTLHALTPEEFNWIEVHKAGRAFSETVQRVQVISTRSPKEQEMRRVAREGPPPSRDEFASALRNANGDMPPDDMLLRIDEHHVWKTWKALLQRMSAQKMPRPTKSEMYAAAERAVGDVPPSDMLPRIEMHDMWAQWRDQLSLFRLEQRQSQAFADDD